MILLLTHRGDLTTDWLVLELQRRGAPYLRFNTEDYPARVQLRWRDDGDAALRVRDRDFALSSFHAVWNRRPLPAVVPMDDPAVAEWASREAQEALEAMLLLHDATWINHPERNRAADHKLVQLDAAREVGLDVPRTLVSNDPGALRDFAHAHAPAVVCKPLVHGVLYREQGEDVLFTTRVEAAYFESGREAEPEPRLLQALIDKAADVRVTVIGDDAYAARIDSQCSPRGRVDWRRAETSELEHRAMELPGEVGERCVRLVRRFGLRFGAIDLAERPDGGFTFFELNPNGQWAWIEQRAGLPLAARLADLLEGVPGS